LTVRASSELMIVNYWGSRHFCVKAGDWAINPTTD